MQSSNPRSIATVVAEADTRDPMPLEHFLALKGCSRSQVYRRLDIPKIKVEGRVYIPRSALALTIRGRAQR